MYVYPSLYLLFLCLSKVERLEGSEKIDGWVEFRDLLPLNLPMCYLFAEGLPEVRRAFLLFTHLGFSRTHASRAGWNYKN